MYNINGYRIRGYIDRGKFVVNLGCYYGPHHPVRGWGGVKGWIWGIIILASCEYYFFRVNENLLQRPSNNISIITYNN